MIEDMSDFHYYVGRTIMNCQAIEHDIKLIYAGMKAGDMDDNLAMIAKKKMTLGTVVSNLKALDRSDDKWFFSDGDYELLKKITDIRNHWAHKAYCEFIYSNNNVDFVRQARPPRLHYEVVAPGNAAGRCDDKRQNDNEEG